MKINGLPTDLFMVPCNLTMEIIMKQTLFILLNRTYFAPAYKWSRSLGYYLISQLLLYYFFWIPYCFNELCIFSFLFFKYWYKPQTAWLWTIFQIELSPTRNVKIKISSVGNGSSSYTIINELCLLSVGFSYSKGMFFVLMDKI